MAYIRNLNPPHINDLQPGAAAFGALGGLVTATTTLSLATTYNIEDPANDLSHDLAVAYAKAHNYRVSEKPIVLDDSTKAKIKENGWISVSDGAKYVAIAVVVPMRLSYFPLNWNHYSLDFRGAAEILDAATKKGLGVKSCHVPGRSENPPSRSDLMNENGAGLKRLIKESAMTCEADLAAQLGIIGTTKPAEAGLTSP